jgi:ABC-type multidrug transport system fused ATPase/permease subunit
MLKLVKQIFLMLNKKQQTNLLRLQLLVIITALMEILSVVSIIPFMSIVGNFELITQNPTLLKIYEISRVDSELKFMFMLGALLILILMTSSIISIYTTWTLSMFATKTGVHIGNRLYTFYLKKNWLFHSKSSSSDLVKKIATESQRLTIGIIVPLMHVNAKLILTLFLITTLIIYDPIPAFMVMFIFAITYIILYSIVKFRLYKNGYRISEANEERFRLMAGAFGGIKDVLIYGRDNYFINQFNNSGDKLAFGQGLNQVLANAPRYMVESVAYGTMIGVVLYLISFNENNLSSIISTLIVYAVIAMKLLPAIQQTYQNISMVKGNVAAFELIKADLKNSIEKDNESLTKSIIPVHLNKNIVLKDLTFQYPNKKEPALNHLNITISANTSVGIVGSSGSGKSTLVDVISGLITPQEGMLLVDNTVIDKNNLRAWQNKIGFVAQNIFISEGNIAENVAFGIPCDDIDYNKVEKALTLANLIEYVQSLEQGVYTKVGERGIQISGGQRQRIAIARALYNDADVLIFDEATSALDGVTENSIMNAINNFGDSKTIIIVAHRLKTIKNCSEILFLEDGQLVDKGSYDELIQRNKNFKNMDMYA